jgi:hypothetical protein
VCESVLSTCICGDVCVLCVHVAKLITRSSLIYKPRKLILHNPCCVHVVYSNDDDDGPSRNEKKKKKKKEKKGKKEKEKEKEKKKRRSRGEEEHVSPSKRRRCLCVLCPRALRFLRMWLCALMYTVRVYVTIMHARMHVCM